MCKPSNWGLNWRSHALLWTNMTSGYIKGKSTFWSLPTIPILTPGTKSTMFKSNRSPQLKTFRSRPWWRHQAYNYREIRVKIKKKTNTNGTFSIVRTIRIRMQRSNKTTLYSDHPLIMWSFRFRFSRKESNLHWQRNMSLRIEKNYWQKQFFWIFAIIGIEREGSERRIFQRNPPLLVQSFR